ncbi:MAG: LysR family transcriptional regulator [Thermodesulfovibrionales bacterium]
MNEKKKHRRDLKPSSGLRGRIWIDGNEGTYLGYGRIILLEHIREHGSMTKAARSMDMSYRHAWELVESMNRQSPVPLVETSTGGKGGGGARLTEAGEQAISLFWKLYADFQDFLEKEARVLGFSISWNKGSIIDEQKSIGSHRRKNIPNSPEGKKLKNH